jgi:hypothetical protein
MLDINHFGGRVISEGYSDYLVDLGLKDILELEAEEF